VKVFAIGDLHLGHAVDKPMDIFGVQWRNHAFRIAGNWEKHVSPDDLVLIPGDISWAMRLEEAEEDLRWLERLPGRKALIKGNHDYWWPSISRLRRRFHGTGVFPLQYDAVTVGPVVVGGTRLWTFSELGSLYVDPMADPIPDVSRPGEIIDDPEQLQVRDEKIFARELGRLENSLKSMGMHPSLRVVMTHFPPTNEAGRETRVTRLLKAHHVDICVFGHLHSLDLPSGRTWDFSREGVRYVLVSCDAVGFSPYLLCEV